MDEKNVMSEILERIINNILFLAAQKGIKKSDLESKAGVTPGYLSRFKPGSSSLPSSAFLIEAARLLQVSMDDLVYEDFPNEDPDCVQPIKVVTKLLNETSKGKLKWKSILETEIKESIFNGTEVGWNGFKINFEPMNAYEKSSEEFFRSSLLIATDSWGNNSLKDYSCWLRGTIYAAEFNGVITFMLIPMERVHRDTKYQDRAIGFFVNRFDFIEEQFTVSQNSEGLLKDRLFELYRVIEQKKNNLSRSKDYDRLFDLFLDDLPLDSECPVSEEEMEKYSIKKML